MAQVVFRGLLPTGNHINDFLVGQFGVTGTVVGKDLILQDEAIDKMLASDALHLHPQISLNKETNAAIAHQLCAQVPDDFKKYQPTPPSNIRLSDGYGRLSEVDRMNTLLAIAPETDVCAVLEIEVLPLMKNQFNAQMVTGVSLDAAGQQAWLSFNKIALLAERYPQAEVDRRIKSDALQGVLPFSLSIQAFLDAMTRLSPMLLTLPVRRMGCSWHFQSTAMRGIPSAAANGIVSEFMSTLSPLATETHFLGLHGLKDMSEKNIWRYLRFCVAGINRLMRFLNDPRSFTLPDKSVDLLRQIQSYGAVHLLFADVAANNFSTTAHNRISYAISALDKLANLRALLGEHKNYSEDVAFGELASQDQASELKRQIGNAMRAMNYDDLARNFETVIDRCYDNIHAHLSKQSAVAAESENARLVRIRSQRNLRHGTFLRRNQFEDLFFDSDGTIPDTIGTLPFLVTLGILANPKAFLAFRPKVTT